MLKSKANAKRNLFLTRNKLEIHNKSSFDVRYEVSVYEGQQILHIEKEAKLSAMGVGVGGGNKIDYSKAERMKVDKGEISKNGGVVNVTVEGNKRVVMIRYYYVGLHDDFTDEQQRNFTVFDELWFEDPSEEMIDRINKGRRAESEGRRN